MIDQSSQFMAILTAVGEAKQANADAMNIPWTFSQMGVGDANGADPQPNRAQTKLINERRRAPLNQVKIDPKNTNVIIAEQVIPENVGGWWIREIGLYDADGDLVAVANCAPSFKPELAQGSGKTQVVRINFIVSSAANVTLKIDPSVVLATRQYVDDRIIEVLPPTRKPGSYTKVLIDKRGVVVEGSNPETLADNGIKDAYTKTQVNDLLQGKAALDSPVLTGTPKAPTAPLTSNSQQLANTAFVQALVASLISGAPGALDTLKELADALGGDANFATTVLNALAGKADKATTLAGYNIGDALRVGVVSQQLPVVAAAMPAGSNTDHGWAIRIREAQGVGAAQRDQAYAPRIAFHWGNTNLGDLSMSYSADLMWKGQRLWHEGNFDPSTKANSLDVTNALALKANKATTLGGYNITDAMTTQQTNTAIQAAITALLGGAPGALDTLQELAAAMGGDANFATTVLNKLALKADISTSLRVGSVSRQVPMLSASMPGGTDRSGSGGAMQIREAQEVSTSQTAFEWAPRVLFHWQGFTAKDLAMSRFGELMWNGQKVWSGENFDPATKSNVVDVTSALSLKANQADVLGGFNAQVNGHIVLPKTLGGMIIQWFQGPVATAEAAVYPAFAFPLAFPNGCLFCGAFTRNNVDTQTADQIFQTVGWDRVTVKLFPQWFGTGAQGQVSPLVFAIGY